MPYDYSNHAGEDEPIEKMAPTDYEPYPATPEPKKPQMAKKSTAKVEPKKMPFEEITPAEKVAMRDHEDINRIVWEEDTEQSQMISKLANSYKTPEEINEKVQKDSEALIKEGKQAE